MASHLSPPPGAGPQEYDYNPLVPLKYWLRSAAALISQASIYEREGHDEEAYLLLFRHAQLVLVNLAKHPGAKDPQNQKGLLEAEKEVQKNLAKLETLKPRINKRYERYLQLARDRKARGSSRGSVTSSDFGQKAAHDPGVVAEPLEARENKDLAVKLARTEISRRATVRKAVHDAGISPEEERRRRTAGVWGQWEHELEKDERDTNGDLSRRIQDVRTHMDSAPADQRQNRLSKSAVRPPATSSTSGYKYPTVPPRQKLSDTLPLSPTNRPRDDSTVRLEAPLLPPKDPLIQPALFDTPPPPRPDKVSSTPPAPPASAPPLPSKVQPAEDGESARSKLDPSSFTFKPAAYLENGSPLRTVFLPPELRSQFLSIAEPNTRRNLETCGVLCGTLISNALFISRLIIPEQTSTSDTCETLNESAIFDYCDSEDLMMLGWIHTHPTQTCFMSSRDLHTHCGYQVMLPESFAIVCAPSKMPDWGIFRLTDPPGLKTVLNCTQSGLFHPHAESNIYTDALRPGHVFEAKGLDFEVVDLRPNGSHF
ncbi:endosome-associated ubiquitin isopeptidase [Aspergillus campestris IBT 28561]|uniref:Endosome-associated ubiquitin isopeptidase n=1 Tax=Aspergillus campestris (strain IBT 28561) TaxID=1392248 RepID=A0A2I1DDV0_ASPC2|nr:endosome-associated ubiquitin isopeptidase [Aspergillus campestris IBT 28561]PKY08053.1 endosome-associated ubiquitin isopeptidase [Aspergillus campestris IBT 28561]